MDYINDLIYNYKHYIIFIIVILILNIIIFLYFYDNVNTTEEIIIKKDIQDIKETNEKINEINIDIKGAVNKPGVYTLNENTIVKDAIEISGGVLPTADTTYINLSKKLKDEMVIIIYTKEEINKLSKGELTITNIETCKCPEIKNDSCIDNVTDNKKPNTKPSIININTAPLNELLNIPGIGEVKAKAIIEYRNKTPFKDIKEITNVTGIGDSTFEKIKDYITT